MEFRKYNSIENSYREKFINDIKRSLRGDEIWVVEEKVHGSQFAIWYNGIEFKTAKRSCFLEADEKFNNHQQVLHDNQDKISKVWESLKKENDDVDFIVVHGELAGGVYKHKDVDRNPEAIKVQGEVHYSPNNFFYAFDLIVNGRMMDLDVRDKHFHNAGLFSAIPLFKGTLDDCLKYPNEYITTIPNRLELPLIEDNITEGNVIKPIKNEYFHNGQRMIIKNKNEKFSEKNNKREHKPKIELTEDQKDILNTMHQYVNDNRLKNVLSKHGEFGQQDFGKIMGLFQKDIFEDYNKDDDRLDALDKPEKKRVTAEFAKIVSAFVRQRFLNIIDGVYL